MRSFDKIYTNTSSLFPLGMVRNYEELLITADWPMKARVYLGSTFLKSFAITVLALFMLPLFGLDNLISASAAIVLFFILMAFFYVRILLAADARAAQIEKYLPEALQLVSANIRAGMTIDKALWLCARPEFGPFEKELRKMAAETLGGKPVTHALSESAKRIKSVTLDRAYRLLIQGIELGGALASLLTEIASDIRTNQALRSEINAATAMYSIFIIFASVLAAPMLFAVSTFYVQATGKIMSSQSQEATAEISTMGASKGITGPSSSESLSFEEVRLFSLACIIITTFFGSLTLGLINSGESKRGLKYIPIFVPAALGIYYIGFFIVSSAFGAIMI